MTTINFPNFAPTPFHCLPIYALTFLKTICYTLPFGMMSFMNALFYSSFHFSCFSGCQENPFMQKDALIHEAQRCSIPSILTVHSTMNSFTVEIHSIFYLRGRPQMTLLRRSRKRTRKILILIHEAQSVLCHQF